MFTVVICDKHIIEDCHHKYNVYLKPFFNDEKLAFCAWNYKADTFDDALPQLKKLIKNKKEWRAVVVCDSSIYGIDGVNKENPFDFVSSKKKNYNFSAFKQIEDFRTTESNLIEKALTNPLMRLSVWLCGSPINSKPVLCYETEKESINTVEDGASYFKLINELGLTASEVEFDWSRDLKYRRIKENFEISGELFNPPQSVMAISERIRSVEEEINESKWLGHTEFDYSQFYNDNLYPEKLRYVLCDNYYIKENRDEKLYLNFLTSILLMATNECPKGVLRANRVYNLALKIDVESVRSLCNSYNSKLWATISRIDDISKRLSEEEKQPIDKETVQEYFESNVTVPIEVVTEESKENLETQYNRIGLSKDCPEDEYNYWDDQYHSINKYFVRFLREPRRAVKTATTGDFKAMNEIKDERALRLNAYQKEDVSYVLDEEEYNMVTTSTTQLFNTMQYTEKMKKADKYIRRGISQRMTKKKTLFVALSAVLAYFFGFLPLIFSNFNTSDSFWFAMAIIGIAIAVFLIVGFIYLFVLRHKLINRFKHFNYVISGILKEIEDGVSTFSKYLSHACNVMREFSVLNYAKAYQKTKQKILANHKYIISEKIRAVNELFSNYIDAEDIRLSYDAEPYNYNFTILRDYEYEMPYSDLNKEIDFIQTGNKIAVPVDYVESAILTREELYD